MTNPRRSRRRNDGRRARRVPRRRPDQPGRLVRGRHRARLRERGRRRAARCSRRSASGSRPAPTGVAVAAPQNQPRSARSSTATRSATRRSSRVEVTQQVLDEFGIESAGAVMDPDPAARPRRRRARVPARRRCCSRRCTRPASGSPARTWSSGRRRPLEVPVTHIPVRVDDDAVRWDVIHTLVVAHADRQQPRPGRPLKERAAEKPHRYTFICPRSGDLSREEVCERLASTLAELYRADIDATGQPMSPEPFAAIAERDRALPDRRDPDLDPCRPAVEVARGGADRAGQGDHRPAGRALEAGGGCARRE